MRVTHRIERNAEQSTPSLRIFLDCECKAERNADGSEVQRLWFGWALRERRQSTHDRKWTTQAWYRFASATEAWDMLEKNALMGQVLTVYCHNWDYDAALIQMETQAKERGWKCDLWARAKHFLFTRFHKPRKSILFVDTLNYWPKSVAELGEALDVPKLPIPSHDATQSEWDSYCRRDIDVIATFMHGLFTLATEQQWGRFKSTLPGVAWHAYRHRYMDTPPLVIADAKLSALERRAYHGGRTECYSLVRQNRRVTQLDVNGMYPSVMRDCPFPLAKTRGGKSLEIDTLVKLLGRYLVVADCRIVTQEPIYPVSVDGRLCFPIGEYETTLTTPEIVYALNSGHLVSVGQYAAYSKANLFTGYIRDMHALRQQYIATGNKPMELACKLLMNALYGKFGQLAVRWEPCQLGYGYSEPEFYFECQRGQGYRLHRQRWGEVWHQIREGESNDSIPAIPAHVTAYARVKLWGLMNLAGRSNVLYVDTDSLFVTDEGRERLAAEIQPGQLGKLRVAGVYEWAWFRGPKDYETSQGERIKGIRRTAKYVYPGYYEQERFSSYDEMLKRGVDGEIRVTTERLKLARNYLKGTVAQNGAVSPLVLPLS